MTKYLCAAVGLAIGLGLCDSSAQAQSPPQLPPPLQFIPPAARQFIPPAALARIPQLPAIAPRNLPGVQRVLNRVPRIPRGLAFRRNR